MIKFITGVMASGKSNILIDEIESCEGEYLVIKPAIDTRDGSFVRTRAHKRKHQAVLIDEENDQLVEMFFKSLLNYDAIFIDEVQFFSVDFIDHLLMHCSLMNIEVVASGLLKDFKLDYFPSSQMVIKYGAKTTYLMGYCYHCGEALATVDVLMDEDDFLLTEGDSVQVEDSFSSNHYESLCVDCFDEIVE